jgi:hypothetical protein
LPKVTSLSWASHSRVSKKVAWPSANHLPLNKLLDTPGTRRPLELSFVVARVDGPGFARLEETAPVAYDVCKVIGTPPPEH